MYRGGYLYIYNNVCQGNEKCDQALRINIRDGYDKRNDEDAKSILNPYLLGPMVCAVKNDDNDPTDSDREVEDGDESWVGKEELMKAINSIRILFPQEKEDT